MLNIQKFKKRLLTAAGSAAAVLMSAAAVHAASFSVTLPTSLPVTMAANGTVTTSNSVVVRNTGDNKASVSNVSISGANGWTYDGSNVAGTSYASTKVNTNRFVMSASIPNTVMKNGETVTITYSAKMPVRSAAGSNIQIANVVVTVRDEGPDAEPIMFSSASSFTLATYNNTKNWNGTLYYSTNGTSWTEWDGTAAISSGAGNKLYLKGSGNTVITGTSANYRWVLTGSGISCSGNIESLLDYDAVVAGNHPQMSNYCFSRLFYACTALSSAPTLPATTLAQYCYQQMFYNCTGLASAPELPATTLANYCYSGMFQGCTGLTSTPTLPATTLANYCYQQMFYNCTRLTEPCSLPATTLTATCYANMFGGCSGIGVSAFMTEDYYIPYKIPSSGAGTAGSGSLGNMFANIGGPFKGTPTINTTYYLKGDSSLIAFVSDSPFTIATANTTKNWNGTLYYSTDRTTWSVWNGTTTLNSSNNVLYLRGTGNTIIAGNTDKRWVISGSNVWCRGNLEALLDYETAAAGNHPAMIASCYANLFYTCPALASAPSMPAVTLTSSCYQGMFRGCTNLAKPPELPATQLADNCYKNMFYGCTRIKLSTTNAGDYWRPYRIPTSGTGTNATDSLSGMFTGTGGTFTGTPAINTTYYLVDDSCIAFTSAATFSVGLNSSKTWDGLLYYSQNGSTWTEVTASATLSSGSGKIIYMCGVGNTKITGSTSYCWTMTGSNISCRGNIEALLDRHTVENGSHPAMANFCYANMFANCTALISSPSLPATTLSDYCYQQMFKGCTGLTSAPALPATSLATRCYYYMFYDCSSLLNAPALPATSLAESCYYYMFRNCTSISSLPSLPATTLANSCYGGMFYGCSGITSVPSNYLPATTLAYACYQYMLAGTSITTGPQLNATVMQERCYSGLFSGCTNLTTAPTLSSTSLAKLCYSSMFSGCTSLTSVPANYLPATTLAESCYQMMFSRSSIVNGPSLPATNLAVGCYQAMYQDCSSLATLPNLPATTLPDKCYYYMFLRCTNIKVSASKTGIYQTAYRIPQSGTGSVGTDSLYNMFLDSGGTFSGTPTINRTYYIANSLRSMSINNTNNVVDGYDIH